MESTSRRYQPVIGLELHLQLLTKSKMFAPERVVYGALPNSEISAVSMGYPGVLPVPNRKAFDLAIALGLACGSHITRVNRFARKSYTYPDLPKGYQITQDDTPICRGGQVVIDGCGEGGKVVRIHRMHLEEDTGKSLHHFLHGQTALDFNRCGTPLLEVVTEADLVSGEEAYQLISEVRRLVRYLGVCDGNMEEGSLRCDVNVSVMAEGETKWGQRVEIKNINSMRNVQLAIEHEVQRQIGLLEGGHPILPTTRSFDAETGQTIHLRHKESASEYRYFPEPDLLPIEVTQAWIDTVAATLPRLPREWRSRFQTYGLGAYDVGVLTDEQCVALYFEDVVRHTHHYKAAANWVLGPVKSYLNERCIQIDLFPLPPQQLAELVNFVIDHEIPFSVASKQLLHSWLLDTQVGLHVLAQQLGLLDRLSDTDLQQAVEAVLAQYPDKVALYRSGKQGILGFLVSEVLRATHHKANPKHVSALLLQRMA